MTTSTNIAVHRRDDYYVPDSSPWPLMISVALLILGIGTALAINGAGLGSPLLVTGLLVLAYLFYRWVGDVMHESVANCYNHQVDRSFRQGMAWFIASEVFLFLGFFGALFYVRNVSLAWLGGEGFLGVTHDILYNHFVAQWPTAGPKGGAVASVDLWGTPAFNTLFLWISGAALVWAHWGIKKDNHGQLLTGLAATLALSLAFIVLQTVEYYHDYTVLHLTPKSGIYGSMFYALTGFHALHAVVGAIMLMVVFSRARLGYYSSGNRFAVQAVTWYWNFIVVLLGTIIFFYWMAI